MDKRTKNPVVIGILAIVAVVVFFTMLYYLLGNPVLKGGTDVVVLMPDGAGLKRSDPVQYQGVAVGSVRSIELNPKGGVTVKLRLTKKELALTTDSKVMVRGDVFGAHTVAIVNGTAMMQLQNGDTIKGLTAPELTDLASNLSARAETLLTAADSLLAPSTVHDLRTTAAILPSSATEMRAALAELRASSASLHRSMAELENAKAGPALGSAINRIDESAQSIKNASDNIATASATLNASLIRFNSVMTKIDAGRGTLGMLVNDSSLYVEMNQTLEQIRALAQDLREHPSRYLDLRLFGKKDQ